eukprot:2057296-Pleurochrysis_carterae.AAC.1
MRATTSAEEKAWSASAFRSCHPEGQSNRCPRSKQLMQCQSVSAADASGMAKSAGRKQGDARRKHQQPRSAARPACRGVRLRGWGRWNLIEKDVTEYRHNQVTWEFWQGWRTPTAREEMKHIQENAAEKTIGIYLTWSS